MRIHIAEVNMYQNTSASLVESYRKTDAKNTMLVIELKKEIAQAYQSMQFRLRELDFEKKQFVKGYNAGERTTNATPRMSTKTEKKLSSLPLDKKTFSDEWIVDLKRRSVKDSHRGLEAIRTAHARSVSSIRSPKTPQNSNDPLGEFVLPTIVVDDRERYDSTSDAFLTETNHNVGVNRTLGLDVDMALLNVDGSGNKSHNGAPRIRRMSLPAIQLDSEKTQRSRVIDGPILSICGRRGSTSNSLARGRRRSSVGMTMTKVLRDLNHGILSPELEEKHGTVVSEQEWETLKLCRYLRTPEST